MVQITHLVLVSLLPTLTQRQITTACQRFLTLLHTCLSPTTHQPYLLSLTGGASLSLPFPPTNPTNLTNPPTTYTHGFILTFPNHTMRDYYELHDPAHAAFRRWVAPLLVGGGGGGGGEGLVVLEFVEGRWGGEGVGVARGEEEGGGGEGGDEGL